MSIVFIAFTAEEAGLKEGDIVVEMDGKAVGKTAVFRNRVAATPPNSKLKMKVFRDGKYKKISAITKAMDGGGISPEETPAIFKKLGFSVEDLDRNMAQKLGHTETSGVLVSEVEKGSPAWRAGLQPGLLILSINRIPVENVEEFMQTLSVVEDDRVLFLISDGRSSRFVVVTVD